MKENEGNAMDDPANANPPSLSEGSIQPVAAVYDRREVAGAGSAPDRRGARDGYQRIRSLDNQDDGF
jgi:hypothetical protein